MIYAADPEMVGEVFVGEGYRKAWIVTKVDGETVELVPGRRGSGPDPLPIHHGLNGEMYAKGKL